MSRSEPKWKGKKKTLLFFSLSGLSFSMILICCSWSSTNWFLLEEKKALFLQNCSCKRGDSTSFLLISWCEIFRVGCLLQINQNLIQKKKANRSTIFIERRRIKTTLCERERPVFCSLMLSLSISLPEPKKNHCFSVSL